MNDSELNEFLDALPDALRPIVEVLRAVVRRTIPEAEESSLWGGLSYHRADVGGRVKGAICQITAKRGRVRLEFIHGIRLPDPYRLLRGRRLSKRYVPVESVPDANRAELAALIRDAAALDPDSWA